MGSIVSQMEAPFWTWDPENDHLLWKIGISRKYETLLKKLCCRDTTQGRARNEVGERMISIRLEEWHLDYFKWAGSHGV